MQHRVKFTNFQRWCWGWL